MKQLVAVAVEADQHGTFYHNPTIITDYLSAVKYQKEVDMGVRDFYVEFVTYPEGTDLDKTIDDIENFDTLSDDWTDWLMLEEVLQFFGIESAIYDDGTTAEIGDPVVVKSDDFSWGLLAKEDLNGTVTLLDDPFYIQLNLDDMNRQVRIPHYKVRKRSENNNTESNNN